MTMDPYDIAAKELRGAKIYLDVVSVGATINIMLAASRAKGSTIIENAAKEPEIIDVATLLNAMGAKIKGAGTETIRIEGVDSLHGCRHSIIPDRIQAGTYMIAAAATRGDILIDNVIPKHMEAIRQSCKRWVFMSMRWMNLFVSSDSRIMKRLM